MCDTHTYRRSLGPVKSLRATPRQAPELQEMILDWERPDPCRTIDYYRVYGAAVPDFGVGEDTLIGHAPMTTFTHVGIKGSQTWHYRVVPVDAALKVGAFSESPLESETTLEPLRRLDQTRMKATATSAQLPTYPPESVLDGSDATIWHTQYSPRQPLPQSITIDLGRSEEVMALRYAPRQDASIYGCITGFTIEVSSDGTRFREVANDRWPVSKADQHVIWEATTCRQVRLTALTGVGNYAAASEIWLYGPH